MTLAKSTYLQLCNDLREELGETGTGPASVTSQTGIYAKIVHWIQEADFSIQGLYFDWDFMYDDSTFSVATIAGTKDYTAPATLGTWDHESFYLDYSLSTYADLIRIDYRTWKNTYGRGTQTNKKPAMYTIKKNGNVILHGPPDTVYTLTAHFWSKPVKMTANADTSLIPEQYERAIIARAKMSYAEEQEFPELYEEAAQEYQEQLQRLEASELPGQENRYMGGDGEELVVRVE